MDKFIAAIGAFREQDIIEEEKKWQRNCHFLGEYTKKITCYRDKVKEGKPSFILTTRKVQQESCYKKMWPRGGLLDNLRH